MLLSKKKTFFLLQVLFSTVIYAQNAVDLKNVFDPNRITEGSYKLVMYNQNEDTISNMSILERKIVRERYNSVYTIRISETSSQGNWRDKITVHIDAKTLEPLSFEYSVNDTLAQKAEFKSGKVTITDFKNGTEKQSDTDISPEIFLSNCFSELVQANDFAKNAAVRFSTFTPGKTANQFVAERTGEKEFSLANGEKVDCWIIKFTRTDSKGSTSSAGYRYIDKVSGKVLMFKTDIESEKFFTYQVIFLH